MKAADLDQASQAKLFSGNVELGRAGPKRKTRDDSAERTFAFQCLAYKLPPVIGQYQLDRPGVFTPKTRKQARWAFDFAFVPHKLLIEVNGGIWLAGGGAHSHPVDITRNMEKQNDAALLGFLVLQFTPREIKTGHAIAFTQRVLATRGWRAGA